MNDNNIGMRLAMYKIRRQEQIVSFLIALVSALVVVSTILFLNLVKCENQLVELTNENTQLRLELNSVNSRYEITSNMLTNSLELVTQYTETINEISKALEEAEEYIKNNMVAPDEKKYTRNTDLGVTSIMTVDRMNRIIDYWLEKNDGGETSPFKDQGEAFITASKESGLDPVFIFAIASHESNFGRSRIATTKHNYMGIGAYDASPYTSALNLGNEFSDGIVANAMWVADKYYNQGQDTLYKMIYGKKTYSSSKDQWISSINGIMSASSKID